MELPEKVSYTQTKSQNELMLEELERIDAGEAVPAVEELDTVMVEEVIPESNVQLQLDNNLITRVTTIEKLIIEMRDEIDEVRHFKEITETEGCKFCIKKGGKTDAKSNRSTVVPAIPIPIPTRPKEMGGPLVQKKKIMPREVTPMEDKALVDKPSYEKPAETFAQKAAGGTERKNFRL